jgi:hypothetical protein
MDKRADGLNRRELMGTAAAAGLAATGGGLGLAWSASAAPVVSVHLDTPYVDAGGRGQPYRPPVRSAAEAGLVEPHELI